MLYKYTKLNNFNIFELKKVHDYQTTTLNLKFELNYIYKIDYNYIWYNLQINNLLFNINLQYTQLTLLRDYYWSSQILRQLLKPQISLNTLF